MGCCESLPDNAIPLSSITNPNALSSVSSIKRKVYQNFIAQLPVHCQQEILALPPSLVTDAAAHCLMATHYIDRGEFWPATLEAFQAMKILKALLPNQQDHIVFVDIYKQLSLCHLQLGHVRVALELMQMVLTILLKYTPTNYEELSEIYFGLAVCYKIGQAWTSAVSSLTKALEIARLNNPPNQQRIHELEADLKLTQNRALDKTLPNVTIYEETLDPSQGEEYFLRRGTVGIYTDSAQRGILPFDLSEIQRVPDKQTESQVTEAILKQMLTVLDKDLNEYSLRRFEEGCTEIEFIAANYKQKFFKGSPYSPAIIEAALTIISDRLKVDIDDEQLASLKKSPLTIFYTDDDRYYEKGVRAFHITTKEGINLNKSQHKTYIDIDFHQFASIPRHE